MKSLIQRASHLWHSRELAIFEREASDVEASQRAVFSRLMTTFRSKNYPVPIFESYEEAAAAVPLEDFETQSRRLDETWRREPDLVWQPTSGSTGGRKWIPYTVEFRADTQRVASVWLADLGRRYPGILRGTHYWSLSWLPDELRERGDNDDSRFLPWWQRRLMKSIFAVPSQIQKLPTNEETWFATLVYLANDDSLALMSVWSPTFALRLLEEVRSRRDEIVRSGDSFLRARGLPSVAMRSTPIPGANHPDFFQRLWPRLALISSWDSATSQSWAAKLRLVIPHVAFQGKGLWATEGPVTIPIGDRKVLCASSHFYEFRRFATGEIVPAWKLEEGEEVQPLLWSSSGLIRLPLSDGVRVSGFHGKVPCLDFQSRLSSTDLVGEKIEARHADSIAERARALGVSTAGLFAVKNDRRYVLVTIGAKGALGDQWIESELRSNHHYLLARELEQLQAARVCNFATYGELEATLVAGGFVRGQIKIEALCSVDSLGQENGPEKPEPLDRQMGQTYDH
ncbi:MAG: GH3 auxin-responsive promoter family protein [Bdellovibrionota bacterium]